MSQVTQILVAIEKGDAQAVDKLFPLVYQELRQLAARRLNREAPGQTLQATALVNEAYLRLIGGEDQNWSSRYHFFSAAAEAMRRILIDNARRKKSMKHGGGRRRVDFEEVILAQEEDDMSAEDLIALDEALEKLSKQNKTKAELVKLRYFAGLTMKQAAEVLGFSHSTADEHWAYAKAWLHHEITKGDKTT